MRLPSLTSSTPALAVCALWLAHPREALAHPARCFDLSPLLEQALSQDAPPAGAATDLLVSQAIQASCGDAARWLPATCGSPLGAGALALRQRLLLDLATLPARATEGGVSPSGGDQPLLLAGALLAATLTSGDLRSLAWALGHPSSPWGCPGGPGADLEPLAEASDPLRAAASLLARLAVGDEPLAALIRDLEARQGGLLSAEGRGQLEELALVARFLRSPADPADLPGRARSLGRALALAARITARRSIDVPPPVFVVIERVARGDLGALLRESFAMAAGASSPPPPAVAEAARLVLSLAEARSEAELRRRLRSLLLPWTEPWILDANASFPRLESGDSGRLVNVFGDLSLGYQGERWGAVTRGMFSLYELRDSASLQRNYRALGDAEGWVSFRASRGLQAEARLSAGVTSYGTRHNDLTRSNFRLDRETSVVARGTALGALKATLSPSFAVGLWLGLGGQYEDYRSRALASLADSNLLDRHSTSAAFESRFRLQWSVLPGWLGLRARADLLRFSITRDSNNFVVNTQVINTVSRTTATQLDLNARVFLDLDALGFFGFLPSAHAGLDLYQQTADGQTLRSTIPLAGLGLRRETFLPGPSPGLAFFFSPRDGRPAGIVFV